MSDEDNQQTAPPDAVESDPTKRYWRFEDVLGSGACKTVFKAFDSLEGTEVAWNKVSLAIEAMNQNPMKKRLFLEIHVLKRLQHKNIMTFHDSWLDTKTNTLNFITELFTHGSLKRFRAQHKHLNLQVVKKWVWQILQGLVYLHGHEPPIIHRDLKCDNIFINGVTGDIKIGDLGLATLWQRLAPLSVIGTPEFMAPEYYDEKYDEKVDVYAFGMLLLELVSMEYPYCECTNPLAIYKRVSQGVRPLSLQKITNPELIEFIELCIAYEPENRPEARQLLKHPFFNSVRLTMDFQRSHPHYHHPPLQREQSQEKSEVEDIRSDHTSESSASSYGHLAKTDEHTTTTSIRESGVGAVAGIAASSVHDSVIAAAGEGDSQRGDSDDDNNGGDLGNMSKSVRNGVQGDNIKKHSGINFKIECTKVEGGPILDFSLKYREDGGIIREINFPFNIEDDTAEQIVMELEAEKSADFDLLLTEEEAATIGHLIGEEVDKWRMKDDGKLHAFVNVTRKACEGRTEDCQETMNSEDSQEVRQRLELKVDDMCQTMATDFSEEHVFKTLDEQSPALMDIVPSKDSAAIRRSLRSKISEFEDDLNSEGGMNEGNVLFSSPSVNQKTYLTTTPFDTSSVKSLTQDPDENENDRDRDDDDDDELAKNGNCDEDADSVHSVAIDIPKKRRMSATFERSHSISSTLSDARVHHSSEGCASPCGKYSIHRRLSGRNFSTSEYNPGSSLRNSFKRSLSLAHDIKNPSSSSCSGHDLAASSAPVPVGFSVVVIDAKPESESPSRSTSFKLNTEKNAELESCQENKSQTLPQQQMNNTSLISVVTVKPSTPIAGYMPTVPESPTRSRLNPTPDQGKTTPTSKRYDRAMARSRADELAWRIANEPLVKDSEIPSPSTRSSENSPRSLGKGQESNASSPSLGDKMGAEISSSHDLERTAHLNTSNGGNLQRNHTLSDTGKLPLSVGSHHHQDPGEDRSVHGSKTMATDSADATQHQQQQTVAKHSQEKTNTNTNPAFSDSSADFKNHSFEKSSICRESQEKDYHHQHHHHVYPSPNMSYPYRQKGHALSIDGIDFSTSFMTSRPETQSEYQYDKNATLTGNGSCWNSGAIRAVRPNRENVEVLSERNSTYSLSNQGHLTAEAQRNLERMFNSCDDFSHLASCNPSSSVGVDPNYHPDPSIDRLIERRQSSFNDIHVDPSGHKEDVLFDFRSIPLHRQDSPARTEGSHRSCHADKESRCLRGEAQLSTDNDSQKLVEHSLKKSLRRRQAEENIGKMQEQELQGLCSGGSVGVGLHRPRSTRPSMNGSVNL